MIDGSEKRNGWLNLELQSPHVIERSSNSVLILYRGIRCWDLFLESPGNLPSPVSVFGDKSFF